MKRNWNLKQNFKGVIEIKGKMKILFGITKSKTQTKRRKKLCGAKVFIWRC